MHGNLYAIRLGLSRGWLEFKLSLRSPNDNYFYLFMGGAVLTYLIIRRNTEVEGTDLLLPAVAMPSILGAMIAFGFVMGPAFQLAMEREDGTLLRAKAVPRGMVGHVTGQLVNQSLQIFPTFLVILVPGFFLFDLMQRGASGWLTMLWVTGLGILAVMPIGIIIGSLAPSTQKVGTWGMLPVMGLAGISGIFYPVQELWGWLQVVAQIFPMYWLGLGMRSAFLPDPAAALEIGGSWRTAATIGVLGAWALVGLTITPVVLRRMARRTSGSQVEAAKQQFLQWGQ
jgi:ABC-2 type transport system permease protein